MAFFFIKNKACKKVEIFFKIRKIYGMYFNVLSYLNDIHLVPSVVLRDNELLTKVPMDIDT